MYFELPDNCDNTGTMGSDALRWFISWHSFRYDSRRLSFKLLMGTPLF